VRVLVAMSGGVDSSVAAALLRDAGHDVVGCTLKLWGGESDAGCCSAADVDDARRVAQVLGLDHHVFNLSTSFDRDVVAPYVAAHRRGETPNPCVACNRSIKFGELLERAARLGFDAVATGHHARVVRGRGGRVELRRGADAAKDQSYVLGFLGRDQLERLLLPVGERTKAEVRAHAAALGLRTAAKRDSQEVCFVPRGGRRRFLGDRTALTPGQVVERASGRVVGRVPAVELVTVGQRRGLGIGGDGAPRYAARVDVARATVYVATDAELAVRRLDLDPSSLTWSPASRQSSMTVLVQTSAHGTPVRGVVRSGCDAHVALDGATRPVAAGQLAVFYDPADPTLVVGSATVTDRMVAPA
jgi:tRNA-specific 2-thiouridylase